MADKETILITGASGFIGGWLTELLYLNNLANVRAGIRSWSSAARLARFPLEIVPCDVMDQQQITQAMTGATVVVHCAMGLRDITVQGTKNMLEVASKLGVKRFVHLSTIEVYGDVDGEIDETAPFQYTGREYGDAKIDAEKLCWEFYEKGVPVTVLRPSIVYGPFSKDWVVRVIDKFQSGNWGIFEGYGEGICPLVYVSDVVSGILLAIKHKQAVGEAFNLNGSEMITWNQYFQRFNTALGLPELKVINPAGSKLRAAMLRPTKSTAKFILNQLDTPLKKVYERYRGARQIMRFAETTIKTTASSTDLSLYNRKAIYLTSKAEKMLGYDPKLDVDAGLQMTVAWLKHLGLVS